MHLKSVSETANLMQTTARLSTSVPIYSKAHLFCTWFTAMMLLGFSAIVAAGIPTLITLELPIATSGTPYSANLFIGGVPAPTSIELTGLPTGLTYTHNGSGSVAISGTPPSVSGSLLVNIVAVNSMGMLSAGLSLKVLPTPAVVNNASAIAKGALHTCALANGGVQCWGYNGAGTLGDGTSSDSTVPVQIFAPGSGVTAISSRNQHTCALVKGGVQCWGENEDGQIGDGSTTRRFTPTQTIGLESGVTGLSAGRSHTCAIKASNVLCWGKNDFGQLGDGTFVNRLVPTSISNFGNSVNTISAGNYHTCAIIDGGVKCVGANFSGQLGDGTTSDRITPIQSIAAGSGVTSITAASHTCAVVNAGVRCWGFNDFGQLGDGSTTIRTSPIQTIPAGSGVTNLDAGYATTCAVANGGIKCWGSNALGQLGDGKTETKLTPIQTFASNSAASGVAVGDESVCALVNGSVVCIGGRERGQLGDGTGAVLLSPLQTLSAGSGATAVSSGYTGACTIVAGGVQCWGKNADGTVGDGTTVTRISPVQTIAAGSGVTSISTGFFHSCAVANGGVLCWGANGDGSIGDGTLTNRLAPVQTIAANSGVTSVAVGLGNSCAVVNAGLYCWGRNDVGQLGDGSTARRVSPVQIIPPNSAVTAVSTGQQHACAVVAGGIKCWGANGLGQLGDGTTTARRTPVQSIASGSAASGIAAGAATTCAVLDGGVRCWGWNASGQVGDGTIANRLSPFQSIPNGSDVVAVATGTFHSCALQNTGVRCWGGAELLGGGSSATATDAASLVALDSGTTSVSAGALHTCAAVNGGVVCWGRNDNFQLGDASIILGKKVTPHLILSILPQAIAFTTAPPQSVVIGATPITLAAVGGDSGNPIVFTTSSSATICTITANQINFVGVGTCSITANQAGNLNYYAAPTFTTNIVVNQIPQVITIAPTPPSNVTFGATPITLTATGGASGNPVALATTSAASICIVNGNQVQFIGAGTCNVVANQAGSTNYSAAPTITTTIMIAKATQALSFAPLPPETLAFGSSPIALNASSGASGSPVVFATSSAASVCTVTGAQLRVVGLGSCVVTADQAGNNNYSAAPQITTTIAIGQAVQTTTFNPTPPTTVAVGGALIALTANGGASGNAVSFTTTSAPTICTIIGTQLRTVGVGTCMVTANQAGNINYSAAAPVTATIVITQGSQSINFSSVPFAAGTTMMLNPTGGLSGNPVTYISSTPAICTVMAPNVIGVSAGTCTILLNQAGNTNYAAAPQVSQNITILGIETVATNRYRIFIPVTGGHLYTTDKGEYDALIRSPGTYVDEGIDHKIFKSSLNLNGQSTVPYYRLFIIGIRQHFWTTDANEYNVLRVQNKVLVDEGIDGYMFLKAGIVGTVPLYRLVLKDTAVHHWTVDKNEFDFLVNTGVWLPEGAPGNPNGVTGYVLPK